MPTYPIGRPSASAKSYRYNRMKKRYTKKRASANTYPKKKTNVARQVSKLLANYGENKFRGSSLVCLPPVPKPAGSQPISYCFVNTGRDISGLLPEFISGNSLDLFKYEQGDDDNQRVGNSMFIRNTHIKGEIQMLPVKTNSDGSASLNATTDFRMMVVKANRKYNPFGKFPDPGKQLLLTTENGSIGYDNTGTSNYAYFNQPINKRQFLVYKDIKFTLSPPSVLLDSDGSGIESVNLQNPKYAIKRKFDFKLPVNRKCHFNSDPSTGDTERPTNLDGNWMIIVQAVPSAYCDASTQPNRSWTMSIQGTTTARDS